MRNKLNTYLFFFFVIFSVTRYTEQSDLINSMLEVEQNSIQSGKPIEGKMNINGVTYNAICECDPVDPGNPPQEESEDSGPKCDPSKLKIHQERDGMGASFQDVRNLIGPIEELNYVQVPTASFRCLDGRNNEGVLSTPGGDAGEFILSLMVYEDLIGGGKKLSQTDVDSFLARYLKNMKQSKFFMCTDDNAVAHIEKELAVSLHV